MTDQPTPRPAGLDNLLNYVAANLPAEDPATSPKPDHPYGPSVLRVIAVSLDPIPLDCEDDDTAHVWVRVPGWTPRRAFLTGARPFAQAASCEPADLTGRTFFARLNLNAPPTNDDTRGERLEWPELQECPPLPAEWLAGREEQPAVEAAETCGKCKRPFDPADTAFDGRARYHLTPYCRGCVDRCHDNESADHRCVICA